MTISTTQGFNMNKNEFDVILAFTMAVKRGPKPDKLTLDALEKVMLEGDKRLPGYGGQIRKRAQDLSGTVEFYGALLHRYAKGDKFEAYKAKHSKQPAVAIWNAAITGEIKHLNPSQKVCVGVLKKRIAMWDGFAEQLRKTQ